MTRKPIMLPKLGTNRGKPEIARRVEQATQMKPRKQPEEKNSLNQWNEVIQGYIKKSMPLLTLEKVKLPTIEEVFLIMQEHQNKLGMAFRNNKWGEIPAIEAETKKKLDDIGLGIYIDFTPDDKKKVWDQKVAKLAKS